MNGNSIINDIKMAYHSSKGVLVTLILINVGLFVLANLVKTVFVLFDLNQGLFQQFVYLLSLPASFSNLIYRPWTFFTYMFFHLSFFHILFNMLWLYWMGKIFLDFLSKNEAR